MKIECEHCGAIIHIDKDRVCSRCGAPYNNNKQYKKLKEENENIKKQVNKIAKNIHIKSKSFIIIVGIFILLVGGVITYTAIESHRETVQEMNKKDAKDFFDNILKKDDNSIDTKEDEKTVNINESASMKSYDMTLDEIREYKYDWYEKAPYKNDTIKYYAFHLVVKNKTEETIYLNKFTVTYTDDKGNENVTAKIHSPNKTERAYKLDSLVDGNLSISGYIFYELPSYVKEVKIKYGKYLTINASIK